MTSISHHLAALVRLPTLVRWAGMPSLGGAAALTVCSALSMTAFAAGKVTVRLEGDIAPECAIAGGASVGGVATVGVPLDVGDVSRPGRREYAFALSCNAPFTYRLEAEYGALTNTGGGSAQSGSIAAVPYDVSVHIPTDGSSIDDRCTGESIRAGQVTCPFSTSGDSIALASQAQLTITWRPPGEMPLAGAYVERLTVRVATSL
jgi:hypothetical protein